MSNAGLAGGAAGWPNPNDAENEDRIDDLYHASVNGRGEFLAASKPEEFAEFQKLNQEYKEKFGFPFIVAVKGLTRPQILQAFRERVHNPLEVEFQTALEQIHKIAGFRLEALS